MRRKHDSVDDKSGSCMATTTILNVAHRLPLGTSDSMLSKDGGSRLSLDTPAMLAPTVCPCRITCSPRTVHRPRKPTLSSPCILRLYHSPWAPCLLRFRPQPQAFSNCDGGCYISAHLAVLPAAFSTHVRWTLLPVPPNSGLQFLFPILPHLNPRPHPLCRDWWTLHPAPPLSLSKFSDLIS